jgi:single-stranded-DNA-specific exonuclease
LRARLNDLARRSLKPEDLQRPLRLDAGVGLGEMTFEMLGQLDQLQPMGQGNPVVQFFAQNLSHARPLQRIGAARQHVKMWVTDGAATLEAVWWNGGGQSLPVGKFDLAFVPQINEFNGKRAVQLKMLDWRAAE